MRARPRVPAGRWVISGTKSGAVHAFGAARHAVFQGQDHRKIHTSDSLSIQITGGGGVLSDGVGFSGLTESAAGVYLLWDPRPRSTRSSKRSFLLRTRSPRRSLILHEPRHGARSHATTTVTVTSELHSVSTFLADQSTLDQTPGRLRHSRHGAAAEPLASARRCTSTRSWFRTMVNSAH